MSKLYGWGASVVILGALFKINHYPGANIMLIIGLGTEATIFFFSAFEPPFVEPDWSLVYPELAGMYHGSGEEMEPTSLPTKNKDLTKQLDRMLADAKVGPELIQSLGDGLRSLSDKTAKLSDVADASVATNEYVQNMKSASQSVSDLNTAYKKKSEVVSQDLAISQEYFQSLKGASVSVNNLSNAYNSASQSINKDLNVTHDLVGNIKAASDAAVELRNSYSKSSELLAKSAAALDFSGLEGGSTYMQQLQKISANLSALNSVYELQLQSSQKQVNSTDQLQERLDMFIKNLNNSIEKTGQYQEGLNLLSQNVAALNKIYGNMLAAMNVNLGK